MKSITINLNSFTNNTHFELLEVSRRKQFIDGEATEKFDTVYKVLINYEPIEIKISDSGSILNQADVILARKQSGNPVKISFENCIITISPRSQYELFIRGTASKMILAEQK